MVKEYLFKPKNALSILLDYPELSEEPEFQGLTARQMAFVYHYSNPTSDFLNIEPEIKKIRACLKESLPNLREDELKEYLSGKFPAKVREAIKHMSGFKPDVRSRANKIAQKAFDRLESMMDVDDKVFAKMDTDDKKKYAELIIKVSDSLPGVIRQMERGFGITEGSKDKEDISGPSLMEKAMEQENE